MPSWVIWQENTALGKLQINKNSYERHSRSWWEQTGEQQKDVCDGTTVLLCSEDLEAPRQDEQVRA